MSALQLLGSEGLLHLSLGFTPKIDPKLESKPWSEHCQIEASNDVEAIFKWLEEYQHKKNTYLAYKREALRFLLWCTYQQGKTLGSLKKEDFASYFLFLQAPPQSWCEQVQAEKPKTKQWRPFKGALSRAALLMAIRILNSLFNYLVQADYIRANPIKLMKQYAPSSFESEAQKYQVWERILTAEEWQAVQNTLLEMPESSRAEIDNKMRTQFLFALLYFLGLRIHEVVNHSWSSFRQKNGQWWFFVKGKGDKLGHIPVNQQLLEHLKIYRAYLNKTPLPESDEMEYLLVSRKTQKPLKTRQLYSLVKKIGQAAAEHIQHKPEAQEKLRALSPHWLRHLAASHQDKLGMPMSMIKENLRHQSSQTTQIYVHAEDDARFVEMQKMQMLVKPKMIAQPQSVIGIEYCLNLNKGPVNKTIGLARLLIAIEQQVFKGLEWLRIGESEQILLEKVKAQGVYAEKIALIYQLSSADVIAAPKIWAEALARQAEIWLFSAEVQIREIEA